MWAYWTTVLHRASDEFWALTPREIHACFQAHERYETAQNIRFGTIAAAVYNTTRKDKKSKVWQWSDFFHDPRPKVAQTAEKIGAAFDTLTALIKANRGN